MPAFKLSIAIYQTPMTEYFRTEAYWAEQTVTALDSAPIKSQRFPRNVSKDTVEHWTCSTGDVFLRQSYLITLKLIFVLLLFFFSYLKNILWSNKIMSSFLKPKSKRMNQGNKLLFGSYLCFYSFGSYSKLYDSMGQEII